MTCATRSVQLKGLGDEITLLFAPVFDGRMQLGKADAIPVMKPIARIVAITFDVPDMGLQGFDAVEVPVDQVAIIAKLVTPTEHCKQQIKCDIHYHVDDLRIEHMDGSMTTLHVHWTGHNPAAVSLDDRTF